jgi:hypothetical protein
MDLREDFQEFSRRMRCKWYFKDNVTPNFSEIPALRPKSTWAPPERCPALELFLSENEKELLEYVPLKTLCKHNLNKDEWQILKMLIENNSVIFKQADKGIVCGCLGSRRLFSGRIFTTRK